tara:strand:+ start:5602 stop:6018 length:417 start_codon:yes stop_codon:yes gene_type:complete
MFLKLVINNFLILIVFQIFIFNALNLKKSWFLQTLIIYSLICVYNYNMSFNLENSFDYFLLNASFVVSYILFLTLVFNDSPSIIYLKKNKKLFLKKKFIKNRLILMRKDKLIIKNRVTTKGMLAHKLVILLSTTLFKD